MVRRDTTGLLTATMEESLLRGRELLAWAGVVRTQADFESWHHAKTRWTRRTSRMLAHQFEREAVEEFLRANLTLAAGWQQRLRAELAATGNAIELLGSLGSTLRW
jgi:hypothetical protein